MSKVLIIDDSPTQLQARQLVLRAAGFSVATASTAESALRLLRDAQAGPFGVIVTDHVMPGGNGTEFVREMRRIAPSMPVIVISGMPEAEDQYSGLDVIFLQKPCPPPELVRHVRNYLNQQPENPV